MNKMIEKIKNGYDNLVNGTKLGYYMRKTVSTKNAYLFFIVFGSIFVLGTYVSYALFTVAQEKEKAFNLVVGNLTSTMSSDDLEENQTMLVEANTSRVATITLTNNNAVDVKYNLNYTVTDNARNVTNDSVSVKYVEVSKDKPNQEGQYLVDKASNDNHEKEIKVILINDTDTDKIVHFDAQVGLSNAILKTKAGVNLVNQEFKYEFDQYKDLNTTSIPYLEGDTNEKEYKISYKENEEESLYAKVNKETVYMDVSETLDSQDVQVFYQTAFGSNKTTDYETYIEHPQSTESLVEKTRENVSIFGQNNLINIRNYFTFSNINETITKNNSFIYNDVTPFILKGKITDQTKTLNKEEIKFGFYGYYKNGTTVEDFYTSDKFSILDEKNNYVVPGFNLYTYDKTKFKAELEKYKKKLYDYDPSYYGVKEYSKEINKAINDLYNKRKVTQEELNQMITKLAKGPEHLKANYEALDAVIKQAEALNKDLYTTDSYNALTSALSNVKRDLYKEEQKKVNQFKTDIENAIKNLQIK